MAASQRCYLHFWSPPCLPSTSLPAISTKIFRPRPRKCSLQVTSSFRPKPSSPPLNEYRSRSQIQRLFVKDWLKTTATEDVTAEEKGNVGSILLFLPSFVKYYCTPLLGRYLVYLLWTSLRIRLLYPLQKKVVRLDCMLDAFLAKVGSGGKQMGFSMGAATARLHFKIGPLGDLKYRISLLRGGDLEGWTKVYQEPRSKFVQFEEYEVEQEEEEEEEVREPGFYLDPELDYGPLVQKPI